MTAEQPSTLKETLFNKEIVTEFASSIHKVYPAFSRQSFLDAVFGFKSLLEPCLLVQKCAVAHIYPDSSLFQYFSTQQEIIRIEKIVFVHVDAAGRPKPHGIIQQA